MKLSPRIAAKIVTVLSCCFIILFVYAAGSKWKEYDEFLAQVGQSPMLTWWANIVVVLVPALEIAIALLLLIPRTRLAGLYAFFVMMVMFTTYIILITHYSDFVPCSCGGVLTKMSWSTHLKFNIVVSLLGGWAAIIWPPRETRLLRGKSGRIQMQAQRQVSPA
ncbi:hypothetical protein DCC81_03445 [Chitinophaga parva]|uniref:Methylamine utilisation protein MauE domain-containing protein n=1 Tax=Chitinophaga parva TaxID=2169414 RepID=A0A2T7BQ71_9BACT|nr:MauE/DoxX family redox-associated membrane protein [Chitinophaga parva]PUZ29813.1 hypothetical protein DCC81_03445 [Chitinophaga parva]